MKLDPRALTDEFVHHHRSDHRFCGASGLRQFTLDEASVSCPVCRATEPERVKAAEPLAELITKPRNRAHKAWETRRARAAAK